MPKKPDSLPLHARSISTRIKQALDLCQMPLTMASSSSTFAPLKSRPTLAVSRRLTRSANNLSVRRSPTSPGSWTSVFPSKSMEYEEERLLTYLRWLSSSPVSTDRLARAGFFFTGQNDCVKCFSCNGQLDKWQLGDVSTVFWFLDENSSLCFPHVLIGPNCILGCDEETPPELSQLRLCLWEVQ